MSQFFTIHNRRDFLRTAGIGGLALLTAPSGVPAQDPPAIVSPVKGKDRRLIVLTESPAVLETPTELLLHDKVTPIEKLFVRNNSQPADSATLAAPRANGWTIDFTGLVKQPRSIDASKLAEMDQVEYEMVLQCSGNSRSLYAGSVKSKGTQWGRGGMGNVRFAGVRLSQVLERLQVEIGKHAAFVTAEGRDDPLPGKEDFEHSLPLDEVLQRAIFATKLNGAPIPSCHGGPVRLVTPGIYGTMQIKWLSCLRFEATETDNYNQIPRYRVPIKPIAPGSKIKYTFDNSRFNWDMKLKSVVLSPTADARLKPGPIHVHGVAFNDGKAAIETVLISTDFGQSWRRAKLERRTSPYAWTRFSMPLLLQAGKHSIWTRAVDAWGRSQPLDGSIHWNPSGYEWNGVEKINVIVG
ncbi:MAG: molybdopterin-dependent oxidoreductase [Planctomycetota bacterium]|nr:molybdopterin-dependent oxidoreductase [Planctomycetota bacterium]